MSWFVGASWKLCRYLALAAAVCAKSNRAAGMPGAHAALGLYNSIHLAQQALVALCSPLEIIVETATQNYVDSKKQKYCSFSHLQTSIKPYILQAICAGRFLVATSIQTTKSYHGSYEVLLSCNIGCITHCSSCGK